MALGSFPVWNEDREQRGGNMHRISAAWTGENHFGDYCKASKAVCGFYSDSRFFLVKLRMNAKTRILCNYRNSV